MNERNEIIMLGYPSVCTKNKINRINSVEVIGKLKTFVRQNKK